MKEKEITSDQREKPQHQPHHVRLPGFLIEEETGLGDVIKKVTYAMGIKPFAPAAKNGEPRSTDGCISRDNHGTPS